MPFGTKERVRAKEQSGYHCMICNRRHGGDGKSIDVHSVDMTHNSGTAMAVCTSRDRGGCHTKIHQAAHSPEEVKRLSIEAAQAAGLGLAHHLLGKGMSEEQVRDILKRRPY